MGGATDGTGDPLSESGGLSPRGRGNRCHWVWLSANLGSIPAWAGQPPLPLFAITMTRVYPRVGGATVSLEDVAKRGEGLSPRGRGNPKMSV